MNSKQTGPGLFNNPLLINCKGTLINCAVPKVMGILNITPDSFFDGGKFTEEKAIIEQAGKLLKEGADILDIGAQSTRPGAKMVSELTETKRLIPTIEAVRSAYPDAVISADTFRASVARKAVEVGAAMINDISAGKLDKKMFTTISQLQVPYVLMHMQGTPGTMQASPNYKEVTSEVFKFLAAEMNLLRQMGVTDIILDPGFGFGKSVEHNYSLLKNLSAFTQLGTPVLAGISRKSMVCKVLNVSPENALNGTTALHMTALQNGASLLRVHDVKEAVETIKLFTQLKAAV